MRWATDTDSIRKLCPGVQTSFLPADEKSFSFTVAFGTDIVVEKGGYQNQT
jgi:hypothetical protein